MFSLIPVLSSSTGMSVCDEIIDTDAARKFLELFSCSVLLNWGTIMNTSRGDEKRTTPRGVNAMNGVLGHDSAL